MSISSVSYNHKIIIYTYTKVLRVVTPEEWGDMGHNGGREPLTSCFILLDFFKL